MTTAQLQDLARALDNAWATATTVPAPSSTLPSLTTEDAYAIQDTIIAERIAGGRARGGWKLGLTSSQPPATPIVGTLLDDMVVASGTELVVSSMVGPMVEAEIVVHIGETIDRPVSTEELSQGPHAIGPGIEVIDYRTVDSAGPIDWIADNSTVAYAVVAESVSVQDTDPVSISAALYRDGEFLAEGTGEKVMGNPLAAVSWLSGHLANRGLSLEKGQVILTGSISGHHDVHPGKSEFVADFGDLGTAMVRFRP